VFALYRASVRRKTAPATALTMMSTTAFRWCTPKIAAIAAAPAAAASVNNQVGTGGACAIALMFSSAAPIGGRPTAQFAIADIAEATRSMFIPIGLPRSKET
jgi:hypothetical protein